MKISNYLIFNFVTIFILVFLPSGLTQVSVRYSTFTYPEITNQPNLTGTQPQILTFTHYNDNSGTAVVRIARVNYYNTATNSYCYEQRLLLRVIQTNGRVIEINYEDATEIQDINYCAVRSKNPLNIYPLFDKYILVTYTHATNTSDTTTYTDRGMVFDWDGNILSHLEFGSSYLSPGTNWFPNEFIVNNITPKKGFLRLSAVNNINGVDSFKWSQYGYNGNGNINFDFSLYNELDQLYTDWTFPLLPILSNMNGAFDVLQNNTILVALNGSTTTWSCFVIDLPKLAPQIDNGYGNLQISSTYPSRNDINLLLNTDTINITYYDRISLSDGNLTIYQTINITKIPRLMINSRTCDASKCIPLGTILNLKVLTSTFNDPGGKYSIEIDNNFVKNSDYNEPILGIDPNIWNFQTNNNVTINQKRTGDVRGKLRLTASGTTYFLSLNDSGRNDFFTGLINELLVIIPTEQGRLDSSKLHQNDPSNTDQLLISLIVYEMKNGDKKNATAIQNDLDQLIRNKYVTGISLFGNQTLLLDEKYGFQPSTSIMEFLQLHQLKIILLVVGVFLFLLLFIIAKIKSPKSQNFTILQIGITVFRTTTVTIFTFTDAKTVPNLYIPSVVFLIIPMGLNLLIAFLIIFHGGEKGFHDWFWQYGRIATLFALLSGANIDVLLILKSYLMELELFNAPLSENALKAVFWGSCADTALQDTPQFIIQIFYLLSSVEYEIIPLFALVASGLSVLSNIISKVLFIKFKKYSPYLISHYDHHAVESSPDDQKSNTDFDDDDSYT
ncbi:hypothetical protein F8M41_025946 [Gigaspora margarita]|uniref:Uncharacterized protein n=1 Tax=Gigaspora margarita TaxID=4874 RepID=A0A8H4AZW0_GIGMA|nr:hypothetical protein F8M41_025946 [Gigaspora margarita]